MKRALLVALMCMVPFQYNTELHETLEEQKFISDNDLVKVKVSCYYAEPGARTANGSIPVEGMVSSNSEHLGMDMLLFDENLNVEARFYCTDIGGHAMLRNGTAVDFYRDDLNRCWQFVGDHKAYVYVKWIPHDSEYELK